MDDLQKTAEECEDIYDKTCSISYPDDGANLPETSEIILAPNNVKVSYHVKVAFIIIMSSLVVCG